jgi:ABC-type Zn uptake system ZnuABC Zn-binding protein ZnuA
VRRAAVAVLAVTALLAGCSNSGSGNGRTVVATTTQVGDFVRNVAGDRMDVKQILQPGSDPHEYEPRPSDALALSHARVVFRSGGDVDGWLTGILKQAGGNARVVNLIDHVQRRGEDPHWWQDPHNAVLAVGAIRDALVKADPAGAAGYRSRAAAYIARLRALDASIRACVARVPVPQRKLVTSHDALAYYAARYGFQVLGAAIPALSTQAQPSASSTDSLIRKIEAARVPVIFPESAIDPRLEKAIARQAHASVAPALWADALGGRGSTGDTYLKALAHNTEVIVGGLTGKRVSCR